MKPPFPARPSRPRPMRTALLAAFLSFLFATSLAADRLERTFDRGLPEVDHVAEHYHSAAPSAADGSIPINQSGGMPAATN